MATTAAQAVDFERDIRPLLQERCVECHGEKKQKGELRLDAKPFAFKGGHDGAAIVAGSSSTSRLYLRLVTTDGDERMPPKGEPLTSAQMSAVKEWIESGAVWPESAVDRAALTDKRLGHWAWQPIVPSSKAQSIDDFVRAELAKRNLQLSSAADARKLIRRLTFDLHGLPPTPEEVEAFVNDRNPRAYEKLVDRLLASPRHGERYARHWLDIAHYADTHGFERDQRRDNAWHYRDYVIDAFNADKPYDQFLREQIAGDVMAPDDPQSVAATGFLAAGPWDYVGQVETKSDALRRAARALDLDDMVTQVMTACCGVTVNCARCHDHKLDPISQREYYSLWAVFAGLKRGDRELDTKRAQQRVALASDLAATTKEISKLAGTSLDLADMVGGGDGTGSGQDGLGIPVQNGQAMTEMLGYFKDLQPNRFERPRLPEKLKAPAGFVDGVVLPNGRTPVPISSTKLFAQDVPATSGHTWDAVRNGHLSAQVSKTLGGIDYSQKGRSMLGLHANSAVTFDLDAVRHHFGYDALRFTATGGFGAKQSEAASLADVSVYVDGKLVFRRLKLTKDAVVPIDLELAERARFLTLMATDGGDGIGSDLLFFGDPLLHPMRDENQVAAADVANLKALRDKEARLRRDVAALQHSSKVYGVIAEAAPPVFVLKRGDVESPAEESVAPTSLALVRGLKSEFGTGDMPEGERRKALAAWITDARNPLTRRVIVNRLWHWHFGQGIINTPSDLGLGGSKPSHPEMLDWLAEELLRGGWSLKHLHKLIVMSETYRQRSDGVVENGSAGKTTLHASNTPSLLDSGNRLLWRQNPHRLEAEMLRDAVLAVSGKLNVQAMGGPGFADFNYTEGYAPVYQHITADKPELWRRSIYRFVTRSTPQRFLTTLDCPDPANLTPARLTTTTALQSLALFNNDFVLRQSRYFAERLRREAGGETGAQVRRAYQLAFGREPGIEELRLATAFIEAGDLFAFCRSILNSNEFVYVD
ncbi:MAG TPA: DUF1553 domain-containing protein [Prosthecobacter sp.]